MKKLLSTLTGTLAMSTGIINMVETQKISTVTNLNTNNDYKNVYWLTSKDTTKYDLNEGGNVQNFILPDLLTLFNELNKIHREKNVQIKTYNLPQYTFIDDNESVIGFGYASESLLNIQSLINSDYIKFTNARILMQGATESKFTIFLDYEIADIKQQFRIFTFQSTKLPWKQDALKTNYTIWYEY